MAINKLCRLAVTGLIGCAVLAAYASSGTGPLFEVPTQLTANIVAAAMRLIGIDAVQENVVVFRNADFAYQIYYRCIGVLPISALAIAILASPAGRRAKFLGLAIGIPSVLLLNLLRLVHLFAIGVSYPEHFWIAHRVLWEATILGATFLMWAVWLRWSHHRPDREPKVVAVGQ